MNLQLTIEIWEKGKWFLARTPELDFVSQGKTFEEAKKNLHEVLRIQLKEMHEMGTLQDYLSECGFELKGDKFTPQSEMVGFEKSVIAVF